MTKMVIISFGRILLIIIGALITAYGLESILIPNNVSDGGVTGISIVGSTLFGFTFRNINRNNQFTIYMVRL